MPRGSKPGERRGGRQRGTLNRVTREIRALARVYGPAAIEEAAKLAGLSDGGKFKAGSEQAQIAAINIILDRAYGKAAQPHTGEGGEGAMQLQGLLRTVDRPPLETREQWLERRAREIASSSCSRHSRQGAPSQS